MRPVISAVGFVLYALRKYQYLAKLPGPLVGNSETSVESSAEFMKEMAGEMRTSAGVMVSLDVKLLYNSLPIQQTMAAV